ncbi:MAG: TRAP transporter large permease subunit [Pseudomonadota bacterium]
MLLLILLVFGLFAGILAGIPVMFSLLGVSFLVTGFGYFTGVFDLALLGALPPRIFGLMANQLLYSVPLFILIGKVLEHAGIAQSALSGLGGNGKSLAKRLPFAVIGISVIIACSSGVVGATIVMLGTLAFPAMINAGHERRFSAGLICASGSLGQIIPPSIVLILLADQISNAWQVSQRNSGNFAPDPVTIGHLFAGALLPGLVLAAGYVAYTFVHLRGFTVSGEWSEPLEAKRTSLFSLIGLMSLLLVPASILFGFATATEASSIGCLLVILIAVASGKVGSLGKAFTETVELTGVIFGIIIAASVFALVFRGLEGDRIVEYALSDLPGDGQVALLVIMAFVFVLGFILEFVEITYLVVPIAAPVLFSLGVDPIWFAILMAVNLQLSFITPPMGISLFYLQSVTQLPAKILFQSTLPFILIQLAVLVFMYSFPALAIWLPSVLI